MKNIGQLLPVDGYIIMSKRNLPINYVQSLTHLYQPLIGTEAVMLYQTLLNDMKLADKEEIQSHHTLMNYLMLPLDKIYEARIKLEAVGLLKTYKKFKEDSTIYTYELQQPAVPAQFFQEPLLATLLYHHIGEQRYRKLLSFFKEQPVHEPGENVTMEFQDVFQTFTPNMDAVVEKTPEAEPVEESVSDDYKWLEQMLKQRMIPVHRVLTKENRKLISQMLLLYDLENFEIDKAILWSLTDENYLDKMEFKRACHDLFKAKNNNAALHLRQKPKQQQVQNKSEPPRTKEESLIQQLEIISPKQLLEDLSGGNFAPEQDMKLIRDVMTSQGLSPPVMNVLIYYVLLQTNMKLTRGYLEKIAGQWSRAQLKTAKEAMDFAKKEKANFEQAKANKANRYQKPVKKDVVPEWFKEGKHLQSKPEEASKQKMTENQLKIANLIRQYSEGN